MFKKLRIRISLYISLIALFPLVIIFFVLNCTISNISINKIVNDANKIKTSISNDKDPLTQDEIFGLPRYFYLKLNDNGELLEVSSSNDFFLDSEQISQYLDMAYQTNKDEAFIDEIYFTRTFDKGEVEFLFMDVTNDIANVRLTTILSLIITFSAYVLITIGGAICSKYILAPYKKMYANEKAFLTNASHELKTPLTIINTNLELIENSTGDSKYTKAIEKQIKRMSNLINEMITLNKLNELVPEQEKNEFNLTDMLYESIEPFLNVIEAKKLNFEKDIQDNLVVKMYEETMLKLFSILLDNAMKYSNDGGKLKITCKKVKNILTIVFYNTCEHVSKEKLENVFDRFYTLDESHSKKNSGFGIGLSIAKKIVELNHGNIVVSSQDEKSICFTMTFKL